MLVRNLTILMVSMVVTVSSFAAPIWTSVGVPRCTGVTKDTSGVLYAAGIGTVWKSTNNGSTWQMATNDSNLSDGFAIVVNPITNDILIAVESGVYRSHDGGSIWDKLDDIVVGAYALAVRSDGLIIAAGSIGMCRSTDNGDTWTKTSTTLGPLHNAIAFSKTGAAFVVSLLNGLFRSTDNGLTWQHISGSFGAASNVQDVVADTANGYVYATAYHQFFMDPTYNKVFRTSNDGTNWTMVDSVSGISLSMGIDDQGNVFSARIPTAYSIDHGASWVDISSGIDFGDRLVEFQPANNGRMMVADMDDSLKIADFEDPDHVCGDVNGNGNVTISDIIFLVSYLFAGGPTPQPIAAGDANSSGSTTIADIVYLVSFLFTGGPAPCGS